MAEKPPRVTVYLEKRSDRPHLLLCWVSPADGRVKSRTSGTPVEAEARKKAAVLEERLNSGGPPPARGKAGPPAALTWAEARRRYEAEYLPHRARKTREQTRSAFAKVERVLSPAALRSVDEDAVARLRLSMEAAGNGPTTVRCNLALVRAFLRWCVRRKLLPSCPHFEMPPLSDPIPPERLLSEAGYRDLRAKLPGPWRRFLDVGWFTGMRRGEIQGLRWERSAAAPYLDLAQSRVWFPPGHASKSKRSECVPVHPELARLLRPAREAGVVCAGIPRSANLLTAGFRAACRQAGHDLKPHDLRRSFGDRFARVCFPQELMELMRHKSFQTTMRYYNLKPSLDDLIRRADGPAGGTLGTRKGRKGA
jgi:integrase